MSVKTEADPTHLQHKGKITVSTLKHNTAMNEKLPYFQTKK